jgi:DNA-binding response OmpR family regulator
MKTILIIEDDVQVTKIYEEALANEGFKVSSTSTGKQGLILLKSEKPDLVILDIMLPQGMNGFDVLEQVKRDDELKKIPIIVLTNLDSERQAALDIGAVDYFTKAETSIEQIVEKVKSLLSPVANKVE